MPLCVWVSACHKASPTPCYLQIEPFTLTTNYTTQGSSNCKVTDVWVYVNNQNLGAYQLPCKIPVILNDPILSNGKSQILLAPGIMKNGITTMRIQYPFFKTEFDTAVLKEGVTYDFKPKTKYYDSLKFYLKEDFELGSSFNKLMGDTVIIRENTTANSLEGYYGKITLDPTHDTVEMVNSTPYSLILDTRPIFIEMNYKCDYPFTIGLLSNSATTVTKYWHETFTAKATWNKVYIDITDAVNQLQGSTYQIIIKTGNTSGDISSAKNLYFDNIKLISR